MSQKRKTRARGYDGRHVSLRKQAAALVASGKARCCRCGFPIAPGSAFDLDHTDDREGYAGVSHPGCNRSAGAAKANAKQGVPLKWSRRWFDSDTIEQPVELLGEVASANV